MPCRGKLCQAYKQLTCGAIWSWYSALPFAKAACPEVASGRLIFGLAPPVGAVKSASVFEPFSNEAAAPVSGASGRAEDEAAEATTFEAPVIVVALSSSELPLDMSSI